ncbi:hypothetical protein PDQ36_30635 [Bacillus cereus]|uniref:hypothetical protein n=1 Tax=Bacillus cereus group TaxID=86661 RepID=UPI0021CB7D83|nr:hypothetical protein [Bacillus cereus]MCU7756674.1 hypothetical protein [Bacillus cereus]MDA2627497.1 hypothetical protein [Bacillus cereus]MDC7752730.1 hypothetical protein [Bacillus cereus]UXP17165.1 hypothetical protein N7988_29205 [Bacillus cereus]
MLYIICGIILFLIFARFGSEGIGCFFFLVISFLLWRIGGLSIIIRIILKIGGWILARIAYYYYKFFGDDASTGFILNKPDNILFG